MYRKGFLNKVFLLILLCFLFASCVLAEKFTCEIEVKDANHYSVHFKGTIVSIIALIYIESEGKLPKEVDRQIKEEFDNQVSEFKEALPEYEEADVTINSYQYQNNGRFYIEYFIVKKDGNLLDLKTIGLPLSISNYYDENSMLIEIENPIDTYELSEYGYNMDGKLIINSRIPINPLEAFNDESIKERNGRYIFEKSFTSLPNEKTRFVLGRLKE